MYITIPCITIYIIYLRHAKSTKKAVNLFSGRGSAFPIICLEQRKNLPGQVGINSDHLHKYSQLCIRTSCKKHLPKRFHIGSAENVTPPGTSSSYQRTGFDFLRIIFRLYNIKFVPLCRFPVQVPSYYAYLFKMLL